MGISGIFNHQAYTDNGNKYNRFRGGKIAGAIAGAGYAGVKAFKTNKIISTPEAKQTIKQVITDMLENVKYTYEASGINADIDINKILDTVKKCKIPAMIAGVAIVAGIGCLGGAIVDKVVNTIKRRSADKKAQEPKPIEIDRIVPSSQTNKIETPQAPAGYVSAS